MSDIVQRLQACFDNKALPDTARQRAQTLFESLSQPVTVAVLGPSGTGKSALINLLLKKRLIPDTARYNVLKLVHGDRFDAEVSFEDGRLEAVDEEDFSDIGTADHISVAAPFDVLKELTLIEASGHNGKVEAAIDEAVESADLVLWCTNTFKEKEQKLWNRISYRFRDHGYLVLTKADKLARTRKLAEVLAELAPHAESEFAGLMPVATLQALKALSCNPMDEDLWAGSGGDGLLARIQEHVRKGRQADLDQAELFLARFAGMPEAGDDEEGVPNPGRTKSKIQRRRRSRMTRDVVQAMRNASADDTDVQGAEKVEQVSPAASTSARVKTRPLAVPAEEGIDEKVELIIPSSKVKTRPLPDAEEKVEDTAPATQIGMGSLADRLGEIRRRTSQPIQPADNLATQALALINKTASNLIRLQDDPAKTLDLCHDTAESLQELMSERAVAVELDALRNDVLASGEHMTLLQLENTAGSAADAVTLLLQLKRDFEVNVAA